MMKEVEIHLVTRRQIPARLVEMFNWQTCKDFILKIITRYPQSWKAEDLSVDFQVELKLAKLAYSTGTRYGYSLASNELLCSASSKYVLGLSDFSMISPIAVELFLLHADENLCLYGTLFFSTRWEDCNPDTFKQEMDWYKIHGKDEPQFIAYESRNLFNMIGGDLFFPLKAYKVVNGYDLAFDGSWGYADYNLGSRLMNAGFRMARLGSALHFFHESHINEKDDPPLSEGGSWVINKETGAKISWTKQTDTTAYWQRCMKENMVRAPQGLEEVCGLLK